MSVRIGKYQILGAGHKRKNGRVQEGHFPATRSVAAIEAASRRSFTASRADEVGQASFPQHIHLP